MKRSIFSLATLAVFLVIGGGARAGQLTIPNSFTSGTAASAADVNANFTAVETAVNDNDTRLTGMPGIEYRYDSSGTSLTAAYSNAGAQSITVSAPAAGYIHVQLSGTMNQYEDTYAYVGIGITTTTVLSGSDIWTGSSVNFVDENPLTWIPFSTQTVYYVNSAQTVTFYANAYKGGGTNSVYFNPRMMVATYYPKRY